MYKLLQATENDVEDALNSKNYNEVIGKLFSLAGPIDEYFVKVMVMDEDENKKNNRLSVLKRLDKLFKKVGDFEKIVVEGK